MACWMQDVNKDSTCFHDSGADSTDCPPFVEHVKLLAATFTFEACLRGMLEDSHLDHVCLSNTTTTNYYQLLPINIAWGLPQRHLIHGMVLVFLRLASSHVCLYYDYKFFTTYVNSDTYPILEELLAHTRSLARGLPQRHFHSWHAEVKTTRCYRQMDKLGKYCCSWCLSGGLPRHCEACKSLQLRGLL